MIIMIVCAFCGRPFNGKHKGCYGNLAIHFKFKHLNRFDDSEFYLPPQMKNYNDV